MQYGTDIINKIFELKLFDYEYYLNKYPDIKEKNIDALKHYLNIGYKEGRNPSRNFNTNYYLESNPDVKKAGVNPLVHYVKIGRKENRKTSLKVDYSDLSDDARAILDQNLFDAEYYLKVYPDIKKQKIDPFKHYLYIGYKEGKNPSRNFNTNYYLESNPDVKKAGVNPLAHYAKIGRKENRKTSLKVDYSDLSDDARAILDQNLFDAEYYLKIYPDIKKQKIDPFIHYLDIGYKEGRNPSRNFNTNYYLESNPDVKKAGVNPLAHYAKIGKKEGRMPNLWGGNAKGSNNISKRKCLTEKIIKSLEEKDIYYKDRWRYYEEVLDIVKNMDDVDSILEIGPYKSPLIEGSDVIDITDKYVNDYPFKVNEFYTHDCARIPYPIEDKKYDLIIACQVMEHFGIYGQQKRIFDEFERISKRLLLSLPYKWFNPNMRDHHMIDERMIDYWANNRKPVYQLIIDQRIIRVYEF